MKCPCKRWPCNSHVASGVTTLSQTRSGLHFLKSLKIQCQTQKCKNAKVLNNCTYSFPGGGSTGSFFIHSYILVSLLPWTYNFKRGIAVSFMIAFHIEWGQKQNKSARAAIEYRLLQRSHCCDSIIRLKVNTALQTIFTSDSGKWVLRLPSSLAFTRMIARLTWWS